MNTKPLKTLLLKGVRDVFNGITVDLSSTSAQLSIPNSSSESIAIDLNNFPDILERLLQQDKFHYRMGFDFFRKYQRMESITSEGCMAQNTKRKGRINPSSY